MKLLIVGSILLLLNIYSFLLMRHDKQCARKNKRRVPEKTLFLVAGCFAALGGTAGMFVFRHKTQHWYFRLFFPVMLVVQSLIVGYIGYRWLI